jgi:hypothetical protein
MSKVSLNLNFNDFFSKNQMKKKTKLYFMEKGYENYKISKFSQYISLALIMFMEDFFTNGISYISKNEVNGLYIFKKKYMSLVFSNYDFLQKYLNKYNEKIAYDGNLFFNVNKVYKNLEIKVGEKIMFEYEAKNYLNYLMVCIQYDIIDIAVSIISYNCKKTFTKDLFLLSLKYLFSNNEFLNKVILKIDCYNIENNLNESVENTLNDIDNTIIEDDINNTMIEDDVYNIMSGDDENTSNEDE